MALFLEANDRELVEYIRKQGGSITARDLRRGPRRYRHDKDLAEQKLRRLVAGGIGRWIEQESGEDGGRPTRVFRLNPAPGGEETW